MSAKSRSVGWTVFVSALGYFVDIYDLLLFGIVRMPSLRDLGVPPEQMLSTGVRLLNMQMGGMLVGGLVWGVLGDLRGRKSVLFGSILMYSLANIANAFVPNVEVYAILRFIAGVGLAGELGAAVTLVSEVMSKEHRGLGTTIVASVGILGAVVASFVGDWLSWQTAYLVGGVMGLGLLALRAASLESSLFENLGRDVSRAGLHRILARPATARRYLSCVLIGIPIWYVIGILITFGPELSRELGIQGEVTGSRSIMWAYVGLSAGDLAAGLLSQWLRSRRRAVFVFLSATLALTLIYVLAAQGWTAEQFYALACALGFAVGYWAVFVTIGAEQFGTNVRATVATTVPNFVRGSVVPVTFAFEALRQPLGMLSAVLWVGVAVILLAFVGLAGLRETFGKDLDYLE